MLHGVLRVLGTGAQWRELPEKYPPSRPAIVDSSNGYGAGNWKSRCGGWTGTCMSAAN